MAATCVIVYALHYYYITIDIDGHLCWTTNKCATLDATFFISAILFLIFHQLLNI